MTTLLPRVLLINLRTRQPYPLVNGFRSIGCPVHSLHLWPDQKEQHTAWVKKAINEFCPDFILSYGWWQGSVDMDALGKILKQYSIPHAYWATEDPLFFEEISKPILSSVDYVFTVAHECVARYEAENVPAAPLPHACEPTIHRPMKPRKKYMHDIVLVANHYPQEMIPDRMRSIERLLIPLIETNRDLKVWGLNWDKNEFGFALPKRHNGGVIPAAEVPRVYSSAKIVLSIQSVMQSTTQLSVRTMEALGCRVCLLTDYTPAVGELFEHGKHLLWSQSADETLQLVDNLLRNKPLRNALAKQGQEKVYAEHTYAQRARTILQRMRPLLSRRVDPYANPVS